MNNNGLREAPCSICGKDNFKWGILIPAQSFFDDEQPFVKRLTRMKPNTRSRCCVYCGNLQIFVTD